MQQNSDFPFRHLKSVGHERQLTRGADDAAELAGGITNDPVLRSLGMTPERITMLDTSELSEQELIRRTQAQLQNLGNSPVAQVIAWRGIARLPMTTIANRVGMDVRTTRTTFHQGLRMLSRRVFADEHKP